MSVAETIAAAQVVARNHDRARAAIHLSVVEIIAIAELVAVAAEAGRLDGLEKEL